MSPRRGVLWVAGVLLLAAPTPAQPRPDASAPTDASARPARVADAAVRPGPAVTPGSAGAPSPRTAARAAARRAAVRPTPTPPLLPLPPEPRRPRDPCDEALRAAQFDDVTGAERAYGPCRRRIIAGGRALAEGDLRTLEDVTAALHALRRADGQFCIAPAAPFDLNPWLAGAREVRSCLSSMDRVISSEETMERLLRGDPYANGRIVAVEALNPAAARRSRRGRRPDPAVEAEMVNLARLVGRQYMRTCRCFNGPQPDSAAAVRAMRLPPTIESVLLRGLQERGDPVPTS